MPRSRSQYLKFSNLCINLDLYLSSLTVIQFGLTAISSTASFFSTCMHICLNGSSTAQRWPPPPNPGCDTGWPPPPHHLNVMLLPKEYFLNVFLQWNFHGRSKPWTYIKNERWKIFTVWVLMVHKWNEWVKEQRQVLLGIVHQVYKW